MDLCHINTSGTKCQDFSLDVCFPVFCFSVRFVWLSNVGADSQVGTWVLSLWALPFKNDCFFFLSFFACCYSDKFPCCTSINAPHDRRPPDILALPCGCCVHLCHVNSHESNTDILMKIIWWYFCAHHNPFKKKQSALRRRRSRNRSQCPSVCESCNRKEQINRTCKKKNNNPKLMDYTGSMMKDMIPYATTWCITYS